MPKPSPSGRSPWFRWCLGLGTMAVLGGCATAAQLGLLGATLQKGTILARALTVYNPSTQKAQVTDIVGWVSFSGASFQKVLRNGVDITSHSTTAATSNSLTDTDSTLTPNSTYTYEIDFSGGAASMSRAITPIAIPASSPSGLSPTTTDPTAIAAGNFTVATASPSLSWKAVSITDGNSVGYLVTVAPYNSSSPTSVQSPVYTALIDGTKNLSGNTVTVAYGSPSNISGFTGDLLSAMAKANSAFTIKDSSIPPLTTGKYIWDVLPLEFNSDSTAFSLGQASSPGLFQVQ